MEDGELRETLEDLANYLVEGMPEGWTRVTIEIEFVDDDVVELSGEYNDQSGATAALTFDHDVVAITDRIKDALGQSLQDKVKGMHLSLEADGALSAEFTYANDE